MCRLRVSARRAQSLAEPVNLHMHAPGTQHRSRLDMPSLIDIRRRIRAVKSTQQITKAMKMVAASRMRRAYERIVNTRPFSKQMLRVLHRLASRVDATGHPLLADRDVNCPGRPVAADRRVGRQGPGRQLQLQRHQGRRHLHRRAARAADRAGAGGPQVPRLLPPPRVRRAQRARRDLLAASTRRTRAPSARRPSRTSPRARSTASSSSTTSSSRS